MSDTVTSCPVERAVMAGIYFVQEAEKADINPAAILGLIKEAKRTAADSPSEPGPVSETVADE